MDESHDWQLIINFGPRVFQRLIYPDTFFATYNCEGAHPQPNPNPNPSPAPALSLSLSEP